MSYTLISIAVSYIAGIFLAHQFRCSYAVLSITGLILCIAIVVLFLFHKRKAAYYVFIALVSLAGFFHYQLSRVPDNIMTEFIGADSVTVQGEVIGDPQEHTDKVVFDVKVEKIEKKILDKKTYIRVNLFSVQDDYLHYADKVKIKGRLYIPPESTVPGTFDYKKYLSQKRISALVSVYDKNNIEITGKADVNIFIRASLSIRHKIQYIIDKTIPYPQSALMTGIILGNREALPSGIEKMFADAGVMHILAVSGLHVGILVLIFYWFFRRLRFSTQMTAFLTIIVVLVYVGVTGGRASVLRAAIMAIIGLWGKIIYRDKDLYASIALAALIILCIDPGNLFDIGFQLSFCATLGIIYLFKKIQAVMRRIEIIPRWLVDIIAVSAAAQFEVYPFLAYYFNKISLIALLTNIFIMPLVTIVLVAGILGVFCGYVSISIASFIGSVNNLFLILLIKIVAFFSHFKYAFVCVPDPLPAGIAGYYFILAFIPYIRYSARARKVLIYGAVIGAVIYACIKLYPNEVLSVTFLDVGQGNCIFIQSPKGENLLIDAGGSLSKRFDIGERMVSPFLWHNRVMSIDKVVLTHPHYNHIRGLVAVCENFKVGEVLTGFMMPESDGYDELLQIIAQKRIPLKNISRGDSIHISRDIYLDVLHPDSETFSKSRESIADKCSLVLRLVYKDVKMLFASDMAIEVQKQLAKKDIKSTIMQISNHGKEAQLLKTFLLKVNPECGIISPNMTTEDMPMDSGIKLFSTAEHGTITVLTNGSNYRLKTSLENSK